MMLNIIFLVSCYPVLWIVYFLFKKAHDRNGYAFGATVNQEIRSLPEFEEIKNWYLKTLRNWTFVLAVIPVSVFFVSKFSIWFTIWMVWMLVVCFYCMVLYGKANKKVQELKQNFGWKQQKELSYTDLKIADVPRKVNLKTFGPVLLFHIFPVIGAVYGIGFGDYSAYTWVMITMALCGLLLYMGAVWTDKQKISVISQDSTINQNYARAKKKVWKNFWLGSMWANAAFLWCNLGLYLFRDRYVMGLVVASLIYSAILLWFAINLVKKLGEIDKNYEDKRSILDYAEDDKCWPYGIFYYNKKDKHILTANRMGTGTTMNMATGVGLGSYVFSCLLLLIIPISCVWLFMLDFTPISTTIQENRIICQHLSVEYEIPLSEIESYTTVTELPEMIKVNGNGMEHVYSGKFEVYREGIYELFLNPQNTLFIRLETPDAQYFISGADDGATKELLRGIEER